MLSACGDDAASGSGTYTVAYSCSTDDPTADNTLVFTGAQNVTVQNNLISNIDFTILPPVT